MDLNTGLLTLLLALAAWTVRGVHGLTVRVAVLETLVGARRAGEAA